MGAEGGSNSNQIDSLFSTSQLPGLNIRIGSTKVRHSRVHLTHYPGKGDDGEGNSVYAKGDHGWIASSDRTPLESKLEEDENWSLVNLLSSSASAKSVGRPRSSSSALLGSHRVQRRNPEGEAGNRNVPRFLQSGANRGGARLWRRPDMGMGQGEAINESYEDNDADTEDNCDESEYSCRMSSGSSISWAEDAVETEQGARLAKLWNDVELVCAGGERPEKMSIEVYEECLLWRRAFPVESSERPNSFESMENFLTAIEVEDGDSTPTNDISTFTETPYIGPPSSAGNLRSRVLDEHDSLMPNTGTTTEFVTSWLSNCQLLGVSTDKYAGDVPNKDLGRSDDEVSGNPNLRNNEEPYVQSNTPESFGLPTSHVGGKLTPPKIWEGMQCAKDDVVPQIGDWIPSEEKDKNVQAKFLEETVGDAFDWNSRRPSRLPILVGNENRFRGRHNSGKPFLLWVFDRVSPG